LGRFQKSVQVVPVHGAKKTYEMPANLPLICQSMHGYHGVHDLLPHRFLSMNASIPASGATRSAPHAAAKARFWDRVARRYAAAAISDLPGYERSVERTRALLTPGDAVLELGCGTGSTALRLASACGPYLATDISPRMIEIAGQRLAASPQPQLRFAVDDADVAQPALDGPFDVVLAFNILHLLDDLDAAVARCARVLRPGGLLISKTPCLREMNPLDTAPGAAADAGAAPGAPGAKPGRSGYHRRLPAPGVGGFDRRAPRQQGARRAAFCGRRRTIAAGQAGAAAQACQTPKPAERKSIAMSISRS
jgi:SAM-dependent methyltransferase